MSQSKIQGAVDVGSEAVLGYRFARFERMYSSKKFTAPWISASLCRSILPSELWTIV